MFPADSHWHADVSRLPVHPKSATYVGSVGASRGLKADFGSGLWDGGPIGIPYTTVPGTQPKVAVSFDYADESDPGPYPVPANAPVEGGNASDGDRHVLVVDRDNCVLYELFAAYRQPNGSWRAGSGARWNLRSHALRPDGWTSADAAGLPILPGLVRYDEVAAGALDHAIRVTVPRSDHRYVWPATHRAGTADTSLPPLGQRFRLKAGFPISGYPVHAQVILRALKKYGLIVADNGSPWYMSGVPDSRWDNDVLHALGGVPGSAFEAVDASSLMVSSRSGQARQPTPPAAAALSAAVSHATTSYAQRITITGRLTRSGTATGVAGQRVELWRRRAGTTTWTYVAAVATSSTGGAAFAQAPGYSTDFQLRHPASLTWAAASSPTRRVGVHARVTVAITPSTVTLGGSARISGAVTPAHSGQAAYLQRWTSAGWHTDAGYVLPASGGYGFTVRPTARGTWSYRVVKPAGSDHLTGYSATVQLRVT